MSAFLRVERTAADRRIPARTDETGVSHLVRYRVVGHAERDVLKRQLREGGDADAGRAVGLRIRDADALGVDDNLVEAFVAALPLDRGVGLEHEGMIRLLLPNVGAADRAAVKQVDRGLAVDIDGQAGNVAVDQSICSGGADGQVVQRQRFGLRGIDRAADLTGIGEIGACEPEFVDVQIILRCREDACRQQRQEQTHDEQNTCRSFFHRDLLHDMSGEGSERENSNLIASAEKSVCITLSAIRVMSSLEIASIAASCSSCGT